MRRFLVFLQLSVFWVACSFFVQAATSNVRHNPKEIFREFETCQGKRNFVYPPGALKLNKLHKQGLTGQGVKVAVIDSGIHPQVLEGFTVLRTPYNLPLIPKSEYKEFGYRDELLREWSKERPDNSHGTFVIKALQMVAPKVSILPIDWYFMLRCELQNNQEVSTTKLFANAIKEAIRHKVDIISLSTYPYDICPEYTQALTQALQKGISIITAAGNDSTWTHPKFINQTIKKDPETGAYSVLNRTNELQAFQACKGKGMLFVGSMSFDEKAKETYSSYSQHPTKEALSHYILAPGENLNLSFWDRDLILGGTSFSAPFVTGGLALLKQSSDREGLVYTSHSLTRLLHTSGHSLTHKIPGTHSSTYKVMNLFNALEMAKKIFPRKSTPGSSFPSVKKIEQTPKVLRKEETKARKAKLKRNKANKKRLGRQQKAQAKANKKRVARQRKAAAKARKAKLKRNKVRQKRLARLRKTQAKAKKSQNKKRKTRR